jgi:hypothetical protein
MLAALVSDALHEYGHLAISLDHGQTWEQVETVTCLHHGAEAPGCSAGFSLMTQNVQLRPGLGGDVEVWVGNGWGMARGLWRPGQANLTFESMFQGDEETFVLALHFPTAGAAGLLAGTADVSGMMWYFNSSSAAGGGLTRASNTSFSGPSSDFNSWQHGFDPDTETTGIASGPMAAALLQGFPSLSHSGGGSLAFLEVNTTAILRCSVVAGEIRNGSWVNLDPRGGLVSLSADGGVTWHRNAAWYSDPQLHGLQPLGMAVGSDSAASLVVLVQNDRPRRSGDGGATWTACMDLPILDYSPFSGNRYNMSQPLAADPWRPGGFYYVHGDGRMFRSQDAGAHFSLLPVSLPQAPRVVVAPGAHEGSLWVALDAEGLWQLNGSVVAKDPTLIRAHAVATGVGYDGSAHACVYVYGQLAGDSDLQMYVSCSTATGWEPLWDPNNQLGDWTEVVAASPRIPGLVAVGSFGRGVFWTLVANKERLAALKAMA